MGKQLIFNDTQVARICRGDILFLTDLAALLKCSPRPAYDCLVDLGVEAVDLGKNRAMFLAADLLDAIYKRREFLKGQ